LINEIAAASIEQSAGIEQVNVAVNQMDNVTQQNAALVEQASAAATSMAEQAHALRDGVSVFQVDDDPLDRSDGPDGSDRFAQGRAHREEDEMDFGAGSLAGVSPLAA
jgi:methyl-accepting chemotaxis protein